MMLFIDLSKRSKTEDFSGQATWIDTLGLKMHNIPRGLWLPIPWEEAYLSNRSG